MSAHTPGPWVVLDTDTRTIIEGPCWFYKGEWHNMGLAHALRGHMDHKTNLANARLIAAAPELLEVVRECRELLASAVPPPHPKPIVENWCRRRDEMQAKAAAALARVEGE